MGTSQPDQIPLEDIISATNDFSDENFIAKGGFGRVYKGILPRTNMTVAVKRLDRKSQQGEREFKVEIDTHSRYNHENMVTLVGFCKENGECILVYEYAQNGSLYEYLKSKELSWRKCLQISIGAARCFNHLHNKGPPVLHRDIKSSNILLSKEWSAKVSDFGLSKIISSNVDIVKTNPCGTYGYVAPEYVKEGLLTKECDVYSFGVMLFEILCGKPAFYKDKNGNMILLSSLAKRYFEEKRLDEIINTNLKRDTIDAESFKMVSMVAYRCLKDVSMVAYRCLKDDKSKRPDMAWIVEKLEKALNLQDNKEDRSILVGTCGRQETESRGKFWSFKLKENHSLSKFTIDHDDSGLYSLMFTSIYDNDSHDYEKIGRPSGKGEEVTFEDKEIIICIRGTINDSKVISSLSFDTNYERTLGPYGKESGSKFDIPIKNGSLNGFYGFDDHSCIYGIGVYLKPYEEMEIMNIGPWGGLGAKNRDPNNWVLNLDRYHRLEKIAIRHDDQIYALCFITKQGKVEPPPVYFGGWICGRGKDEQVIFEPDEELRGINGTYGLSKKVDLEDQLTILTSISFVTNIKSHGPFGKERGTPFAVECDYGEFVRLHGIYGYYIDSIGVGLKTSKPKTLSQ